MAAELKEHAPVTAGTLRVYHSSRDTYTDYKLSEGETVIGSKKKACSIVLPGISPEHCRILIDGSEHFIMNLSTRNRTQRRAHPLQPRIYYELTDEIELMIGHTHCQYYCRDIDEGPEDVPVIKEEEKEEEVSDSVLINETKPVDSDGTATPSPRSMLHSSPPHISLTNRYHGGTEEEEVLPTAIEETMECNSPQLLGGLTDPTPPYPEANDDPAPCTNIETGSCEETQTEDDDQTLPFDSPVPDNTANDDNMATDDNVELTVPYLEPEEENKTELMEPTVAYDLEEKLERTAPTSDPGLASLLEETDEEDSKPVPLLEPTVTYDLEPDNGAAADKSSLPSMSSLLADTDEEDNKSAPSSSVSGEISSQLGKGGTGGRHLRGRKRKQAKLLESEDSQEIRPTRSKRSKRTALKIESSSEEMTPPPTEEKETASNVNEATPLMQPEEHPITKRTRFAREHNDRPTKRKRNTTPSVEEETVSEEPPIPEELPIPVLEEPPTSKTKKTRSKKAKDALSKSEEPPTSTLDNPLTNKTRRTRSKRNIVEEPPTPVPEEPPIPVSKESPVPVPEELATPVSEEPPTPVPEEPPTPVSEEPPSNKTKRTRLKRTKKDALYKSEEPPTSETLEAIPEEPPMSTLEDPPTNKTRRTHSKRNIVEEPPTSKPVLPVEEEEGMAPISAAVKEPVTVEKAPPTSSKGRQRKLKQSVLQIDKLATPTSSDQVSPNDERITSTVLSSSPPPSNNKQAITTHRTPQVKETLTPSAKGRSSSLRSSRSSSLTASPLAAVLPSSSSPSENVSSSPCVMFTGVFDEDGEKTVRELGGRLVQSAADCTHCVTDKIRRTVKLLSCLAKGCDIVSMKWLTRCRSEGKFVPTDPYIIHDTNTERQYQFSLRESISKARESPLLKGWSVYLTDNIKPCPAEMSDIINCAGGKVTKLSLGGSNDKQLIISCEKDYGNWASTGIPVCTNEVILTGILKQQLELDKYQLNITLKKPPVKRKR